MYFNAETMGPMPALKLYDGNGDQIHNAIEIDTVTGRGRCYIWLSGNQQWPKAIIKSSGKHVSSDLIEVECSWELPITVKSPLGNELKSSLDVLVASKHEELKWQIEMKFSDLAEKQRKAFQKLNLRLPWVPKDDIQADFR